MDKCLQINLRDGWENSQIEATNRWTWINNRRVLSVPRLFGWPDFALSSTLPDRVSLPLNRSIDSCLYTSDWQQLLLKYLVNIRFWHFFIRANFVYMWTAVHKCENDGRQHITMLFQIFPTTHAQIVFFIQVIKCDNKYSSVY